MRRPGKTATVLFLVLSLVLQGRCKRSLAKGLRSASYVNERLLRNYMKSGLVVMVVVAMEVVVVVVVVVDQ